MTDSALISYQDVIAAQERLHGIAHRTPVITSRLLNAFTKRQLFLKGEHVQRTGAFKFRGAYNALQQLSKEDAERGVVVFSSGNHGLGTALAAQLLALPSVIVMPEDVPVTKVAAAKRYGAEIVSYNRLTENREQVARKIAQARSMKIIPPYDHPAIIAGGGTVLLEFLEQVPDLDTILVPVGGGGLLAGTLLVAAQGRASSLRVIGVEPKGAAATLHSLHAGKRMQIEPAPTIADGLWLDIPGHLTFPIIQRATCPIMTVTEEEIMQAMQIALLYLKAVFEPSGAAALAAALTGDLPPEAQRIGIIITGGNVDPALLTQICHASAGERMFCL